MCTRYIVTSWRNLILQGPKGDKGYKGEPVSVRVTNADAIMIYPSRL